VKNVSTIPKVLMGDMYDGHWYLPNGDSWVNQILKVAKGNYLWNESKGTGSLSLSFESVFEKAHNADIWISSGQFTSLKSMLEANSHYAQFEAFKNKHVYSLRKNKEGGGTLYYELGPNRPDIVLKDIVKILHPELLPDHQLFFFENLQ
jgi:iron complex transport system substrate-binding protein